MGVKSSSEMLRSRKYAMNARKIGKVGGILQFLMRNCGKDETAREMLQKGEAIFKSA
ncbi:hypothetical protein [Pedobacter nutrimenti]|uniref:hypothetical protein n=1 Tax=Pedobacter nutrimenti TaxID=1241337 RepID=UPI00292D4BD3|nr:hypothetical protein [Pedobacter nutrimenti]